MGVEGKPDLLPWPGVKKTGTPKFSEPRTKILGLHQPCVIKTLTKIWVEEAGAINRDLIMLKLILLAVAWFRKDKYTVSK